MILYKPITKEQYEEIEFFLQEVFSKSKDVKRYYTNQYVRYFLYNKYAIIFSPGISKDYEINFLKLINFDTPQIGDYHGKIINFDSFFEALSDEHKKKFIYNLDLFKNF